MDQLIEKFNKDVFPAGSYLMICKDGTYSIYVKGFPKIAEFDADPLVAIEKTKQVYEDFCAELLS